MTASTSIRLYDFVVRDDSARWRAIFWSVIFGAFIGWGSSGVFRLSVSALLTMLSTALIFGWKVWAYVTRPVSDIAGPFISRRMAFRILPAVAAVEVAIIAALVKYRKPGISLSTSGSLAELRKALETSPNSISRFGTVTEIANRLQRTPSDSADYWRTVLRFIQVASNTANAGNVPPPGSPVNITFANNVISGAVVRMPTNHLVLKFDGGEVTDFTFTNSRIIFTGDPVRLRNVKFINCVFEMPDLDMPVPSLKKAAEQLLASDLMEIKEAD